MIVVEPLDAVWSKVYCDFDTAKKIQKWFSFVIPDAKHVAKAKGIKNWDGTIKLFKLNDRKLYNGLVPSLVEKATQAGIPVQIGQGRAFDTDTLTDEALDAMVAGLNLPPEFASIFDHQREALKYCLENRRGIVLSPTSSGKSLIMYCVAKLAPVKKILILVPKKSLVLQLQKDFESYGCDPNDVQIIMGGMDKEVRAPIVVSTWQSAFRQDQAWLNQFDMIQGDEAHNYAATKLKNTLDGMVNVYWRFGFTGTLNGTLTHEMTLTAVFGPIAKFITIAEMVQKGLIPKPRIVFMVMRYSDEERKAARKFQYLDEEDFIMSHEKRNRRLLKIGDSLNQNTLLLCEKVERHGKVLYDLSDVVVKNKKVHFVHGGVDVKKREKIRALLEESSDNFPIASFGVWQEGVSVRNLTNMILGSGTTSPIRLLQSMGRMFRRHKDIPVVNIIIVVDDLTWKNRNYSMKHMDRQMDILNSEGLKFEIVDVQL